MAKSFKWLGKLTEHPLYSTWSGMKSRCEYTGNKAYPAYGGRGIKVCERWQDFEWFVLDMGHKPSCDHSIDRIDNDGDYTAKNCRWATFEEQMANRHRADYFKLANGQQKSRYCMLCDKRFIPTSQWQFVCEKYCWDKNEYLLTLRPPGLQPQDETVSRPVDKT